MTATSITDPTRFATAELTISTTAQPISVSVSPTTVSVPIGAFVPLTATVNNDSTGAGVTWAVAGCTSEPCGALANVQTTSATYSAPQSPVYSSSRQSSHDHRDLDRQSQPARLFDDHTDSRPELPSPQTACRPESHPDAVARMGDFNADGKLDLAVADKGDPRDR